LEGDIKIAALIGNGSKAEIIPLEPDPDNAGVGNGDDKREYKPYPFRVRGYGF
jgi:hypothetical protein